MADLTNLSKDARKLRFVKRLINISHKHGIYMSVYDGSDELVRAVRDQRSGRLLREALEAHGEGELEFIGTDIDAAGPPDIWAQPEHAFMFAQYVQTRKEVGNG